MVHGDRVLLPRAATRARVDEPAVGWRLLRVRPVGPHDDDRLYVGPGGVVTVCTRSHPGGRIWVTNRSVLVDGRGLPYLAHCADVARRVSHLFGEHVGRLVPVLPVLCVAGAEPWLRSTPDHVVVTTRRRLPRLLARRPQVLDDAGVDELFTIGRRVFAAG